MPKLSATALSKAQAGQVIYDDQVPGLHAKVNQKRASFYLYFRTPDKKERRPKIGDYGVLTVDQARKIAREWLAKNAKGEPVKELQPQRLLTVLDLHAQWQKEHKPTLKPNSQRTLEAHWQNYILPQLGKIRLAELDRRPIYDMHEEISKTAPVMANRVLSTLSNALKLAERWEWRQPNSNPCSTIRQNKEKKRKRYLTPEEMQRLGLVLHAWEQKGSWWRRASRYVRLLIMTGARRSEISHCRREWLDLDNQLIRLPDSKTGEKVIALPAAAVRLIRQILAEVPDSPWLCHGFKKAVPLEQTYHSWNVMKQEAGISDLKLHDLRHSFASVGLSMLGYNLKQVGSALGHASSASTERYAHLMLPQHVAISDAIASTIEQLMLQPPTIEQ